MSNSARAESRTAYRVAPADIEQLELVVSGGFGKMIKGQVVDLSNGGVGAKFDREQAPVLAIGDELELAFYWCDQEFESLGIQAQVVSRNDAEHSVRYGFAFLESPSLGHVTLHQIFNKRGAYRAKPEPGEEVEVQVSAHNQALKEPLLTATLSDISVIGMGISTGPGQDAILKDHPVVDVTFKLPGASKLRTLAARIVARELRGHVIHYGLQFSRAMSQHLSTEEDEIAAFVKRREREDPGLVGNSVTNAGNGNKWQLLD